MNRSAYLTTGLAIKIFSKLSKADIVVHGKENFPPGPTIFVMNHFTRVETFLLPYYLFNLTGVPVWSLAASALFKGGLEKYFDMVGVVSTADPKRDEIIIRSLLTGEGNWIIFPEGRMVKTKKIVSGGKYMVAHPDGLHEPHTGAAALALQTELYRSHLLAKATNSPSAVAAELAALGLESPEQISTEKTSILPINLTYYPIRAAENMALELASKFVKDMPERMVEELMLEGTMMLSGVDLDVRVGKPIPMADYLNPNWSAQDLQRNPINSYEVDPSLRTKMKLKAREIMQLYMDDIYKMTTVNHEHLYASMLRMYPFARVEEKDFKRRVFYTAAKISLGENGERSFHLHKSLKENQAHLLTDDRYGKYKNFFELAKEKGVVERHGKYLIRDHSKLSAPLSFHQGRLDNPIEIMANEVEPLGRLQKLFRSLVWQPKTVLRYQLIKFLLEAEKQKYVTDCTTCAPDKDSRKLLGSPIFLKSYRFRLGVVLIHSYLSIPEEVRLLGEYLQKRGIWVYAPRLPGHGTTIEDLARTRYRKWLETIENSYIIMSTACRNVAIGGVAIGGNLALDLARRVPDIAGVFAVCPPYSLQDYSTNFMPAQEMWKRLLLKMKKGDSANEFLEFSHGNPHVNYARNPYGGIREIGEYLDSIENHYEQVSQPALILQADDNPVVDPEGSKNLYDKLGASNKEFCLLNYDRHVLVNGAHAENVHDKIATFLGHLKLGPKKQMD